MKIGIITDIHNNEIALEAVIKRLNEEKVDGIICCGDLIGIGPSPEETVQMIKNLPNLMACVAGNHERYLTEGMTLKSHMTLGEQAQHQWEHARLSEDSKAFIHELELEKRLIIHHKVIHVIHYAMNDNKDYLHLVKNPSLAEIEQAYENIEADVILYGHQHSPSILKGKKRFINPGSVGCPGDSTVARAGILIINEAIEFVPLEIEYPVNQVLQKIDRLNYPDGDVVKKIFYGVD